MYKKILFLVVCGLFLTTYVNAQANLEWVKQMKGLNSVQAIAVDVDLNGYTYIMGEFLGTVDFNPGVANYNLTSQGEADIFIVKLNFNGDFVWAKRIGGGGGGGANGDYGNGMKVYGNYIYITGGFLNEADFDPGPGVYNMSPNGTSDAFILKLDIGGNFIWAKQFGDPNNNTFVDYGETIAIDKEGSVYVKGSCNAADMDPGPGVFNLTGSGGFVSKLDSDGNFLWAIRLGGTTKNYEESIWVDSLSNVYVTGEFTGNFYYSLDGVNYSIPAVGQEDIFIAKLDSGGNVLWAKTLGGTNHDAGHSIILNNEGDIYVSGHYWFTVDFDPGVNTYNLISTGSYDIFILKLDNDGNFIWAKSMGGSEDDRGTGIAVDGFDNVYVCGEFEGTADFDPGVNTFNLTTPSSSDDAFISKLNSNGDFYWAGKISGIGNDEITSLKVDRYGRIVASGFFSGSPNFNFNGGIDTLSYVGSLADAFVVKYHQGGVFGKTYHDFNENCLQDGNEAVVGGISAYINPGNIPVQTNYNGMWISTGLTAGSYSITYDVPNNRWSPTCPNPQNFIVTNPDSLLILPDFGLKAEFGFAKGLMYHDINENCVQDTNELGKPSVVGIVNPGNVTVYSDSLGLWVTDTLSVGNYTLTIDSTTTWRASCVDSLDFQVLPYGTPDTMSLVGLKSIAPCPAPAVSVNMPNLFRCFSNQKIYVQACNTNYGSDFIINAYVELQLDTLFSIGSSGSDISYTALGNNTYQFDIGTLNPGECVDFWLTVDVSCDAVLGQTLCMQANLYPVDSCVLDTIPAVQTGEVAFCSSPWDHSSLTVDGWCQNDSIYFTVTNTGNPGSGDMQCYSPVRIFVDGVYTTLDSVLLAGGQTQQFIFPGDGRTWRLEVDQHPLHPGNSNPNATVERCGNISNWTPDLVNILPMNDADPIVDIYCGVVTGSYDPNDKTGYPLGVGTDHIVAPNGKLDYVIRFQNTGSAPAVTVVIRDTLDVDLDIFSVQPGVSSHDYTFTMYGPRVLEWTFNNIMLADSASDLEGSKGFVTFTVDQVPNLAIGTEINNSVGIYFDFNEPIITNITSHIIGVFDNFPVAIKKEIIANEELTIYPNPTGSTLYIVLSETQAISLYIYSIDGKLVENTTIRGNTPLDVSQYKSGMYFIKATNQEGKIFQSKFVKE